MAIRIDFDTTGLTQRESQIINALLSTQMTFRGGLLRAGGMSASDPSFESAVAQFAVGFMSNAFPDLNFRITEE
jgi:hypothetical protein